MKFKPTHTPGKIVVELGRNDSLPITTNGSRQKSSVFELKHILVPIDFSECSKKALVYALPYAKEFGAQITLLYVAHFQYAASETGSAEALASEQQHIERAKKEMEKLAQELPASIRTKTAVVSGKPFEEIVATAEALNVGIIIIGTHGAMEMRQEFLGSTAERVARYANCPVLIVREREREFVSTNRAKKTVRKFSMESSAV